MLPDFLHNLVPETPYPPALQPLLQRHGPMSLGPGTPGTAHAEQLRSLDASVLGGNLTIARHDMATACLAGLWLYHDFLDESHRISQKLDSREGSYWHAIMHRREPDYWNSKYWFRRVGTHAIFPALLAGAKALLGDHQSWALASLRSAGAWEPEAFVDACEHSLGRGDDGERLCEKIQMLEWHLLFRFCFLQATNLQDGEP